MTEAQWHTWLCWGLMAVAVTTFVALMLIDAPYGRHVRKGWGPTMPTRWLWVLMEVPACVGFAIVFFMGTRALELVPLVLLGLWQLHYVHRTFIYPLRIRASGKRSPIFVGLMGMAFQALNSYLNARFISELGIYATSWLYDPRFLIGLALFLGGRRVNMDSDARLIALRARSEGYQIPRGGLFSWVSCPNYLGEIVEWTGWAIMTWSLSGAAFALYTFANLAPRALAHHRWYRERFSDYPSERRALFPFVL